MRGVTNPSAVSSIKTVVIEGTLATTASEWSDYYSLPADWTDRNKIRVLHLETYYASGTTWRSEGQGARSSSYYRCFVAINTSRKLRVYNTLSGITGGTFRVSLMYLG